MDIQIDRPDVEHAIHRLSELRGQSPVDTVGQVMLGELSKELDLRARLSPERLAWLEDIRKLQAHIRTLPVLDDRSPDEMLYDADGLPK